MILLIDNFDSFVHNLARHFARLGQPTEVVRNDTITSDDIRQLGPEALVFSPGPCTPREAGNSLAIVRELATELPMLGVCLGHQIIAEAFGGKIVRAPRPVHGMTSEVRHDGKGIFCRIPDPFQVCRYHSLVVEPATLPDDLCTTAWTDDVLMAFQHRSLPIAGVQFHPEAILTDYGYGLLANYLQLAGLKAATDPSKLRSDELLRPPTEPITIPSKPVTF